MKLKKKNTTLNTVGVMAPVYGDVSTFRSKTQRWYKKKVLLNVHQIVKLLET